MIEFNNLKPLYATLASEIGAAIQRVLERGCYILGPEVAAFEAAFARYHGVAHAIGVANGTDAIELALRAGDIGPGDEVITVAHTAVATVCAIERAGATPVLVDIDPLTCTMNPDAARAVVTPRTRALVPVHLYGHAADMTPLAELAQRHGLLLVEDCAQAHGAHYHGKLVGTMGQLGAFSFYPTKNLGALGDGGAIITNDAHLAERLRRLRNYGQTSRYRHDQRGVNSRLDEMQAAILAVKLPHLDAHNDERRRLATFYQQHLRGVALPYAEACVHHVYHLYVVRHPQRDRLQEALRRRGIGTLIHYPVPVHRQPAYADLGYGPGSLPVTERSAGEILSLPMYVGLGTDNIRTIAQAIDECLQEALLLPDFNGAKVLITGGLGFIGSNLAIQLVAHGARVTLLDAMIPAYGGNLFNIAPIKEQVDVRFGDICDRHAMDWLVRGQDYVFHLAGQVSHVLSLNDPYPDIEYNIKGTLVVMEALRRFNPHARVIFTGTRGQYGPAAHLPVGEDAPTNPRGIYEISNLTAEKIIQVYQNTHGIHSVLLRLSNIYGPRAQMRHSHYGVVNWFVRLALDDACINVFGDGQIKRDLLYIDDCVEALLRCACSNQAGGEVLNVGVDQPTTFLELANTLVRVSGTGRWEFAPFSPERKAQEPGDFYSDISKIRRLVGWEPRTTLEDGLRATIRYYRAHRDQYWQAVKVPLAA